MNRPPKKRAQVPDFVSPNQLVLAGFESPFDQKLNPSNRWVVLANLIPCDEIYNLYLKFVPVSQTGRPPLNPQIVLGSLVIKNICNLDDREAVDQISENIYMRYSLKPYIYSLAGMAYFNDYTLIRSLAMSYTADKQTYSISDQFLLGSALMVCPVYSYKARNREVYFPAGNNWYDFYSNKQIDCGQKVSVEAPLEQIPLFVPAGTILPVGPIMQYASEKKAENIEIRVYQGKDGKFSLYEDEGTNYNYEKGLFSTISFDYNDAEGTLTIGDRKGNFDGMLTNRIFRVVFIGQSTYEPKTIQYNGSKIVVKM